MDRRLELISEMPPSTWIHLICVLAAAVLGAIVLSRRKGDARHKRLGRIWMGLMIIGALSSFWIREINDGGLSPIHALSVWTLGCVVVALAVIRLRHRVPNAISIHRSALMQLYASGILIAGAFTFLPHRLLGRLTFGESLPWINYGIVAAMAGGGVYMLWRTVRTSRRDLKPFQA